MKQANPYKASVTTEPRRPSSILWWPVHFYPAITIAMIYGCWAITALSLGRPPEFGEHPTGAFAHTAVHVLATFAALSYFAWPIGVPIGMLWAFRQPFARGPSEDFSVASRLTCMGSYALMFAIVVCIWSSDPLKAINWFWD
ncbi:MAG: hypothetical protein KDB00_03640 [Planctomycetales bacterium]|nr:hypothetical protein [Planctomycetales bacterium]